MVAPSVSSPRNNLLVSILVVLGVSLIVASYWMSTYGQALFLHLGTAIMISAGLVWVEPVLKRRWNISPAAPTLEELIDRTRAGALASQVPIARVTRRIAIDQALRDVGTLILQGGFEQVEAMCHPPELQLVFQWRGGQATAIWSLGWSPERGLTHDLEINGRLVATFSDPIGCDDVRASVNDEMALTNFSDRVHDVYVVVSTFVPDT
jgi:hypothetical protein